MSQIVWISLNTVREHLRDKLFYNLAFFALLLIASAVILSRLTIGDYHRVLIDVGLASIDLIGVMIAVFLGIGLLSRELERRTLYLVLSKPVPRHECAYAHRICLHLCRDSSGNGNDAL